MPHARIVPTLAIAAALTAAAPAIAADPQPSLTVRITDHADHDRVSTFGPAPTARPGVFGGFVQAGGADSFDTTIEITAQDPIGIGTVRIDASFFTCADPALPNGGLLRPLPTMDNGATAATAIDLNAETAGKPAVTVTHSLRITAADLKRVDCGATPSNGVGTLILDITARARGASPTEASVGLYDIRIGNGPMPLSPAG